MKKFIPLFVFALLLTGCDEELIDYIDQQIEEADQVEIIPDEIDEEAEGAHMWPEEYKEETDLYIIDVKYPQWEELYTLNEMVAEIPLSEIELFKDSLDEWIDVDYIDLDDGMKSGLYIDFEIYHNEWDYLSVGYSVSTYYEGAAHGMYYLESFNLDFDTFEEIELLDIFVDDGGGWLDAISYMCIQKLKEQLAVDDWEDDGWIEEGAGPDSSNFVSWTLTDDSIIFHFAPYQVAAYAAGPQKVELTFSELYGLLKEPWASKGK